jgi:hypothetical protein
MPTVITLPRFASLALWTILLSASACGKNSSESREKSPPSEHARPEPPAKPEPKAPTPEAFGKTVAPFGILTRLKIGATEAEVKTAAPEFFDGKGGEKLVDSEWKDLHYSISFVDHRLNSFGLSSLGTDSPGLRTVLKAAWGAGTDAEDDIHHRYTAWFDPSARWRAELDDSGRLSLTQYLPAATVLGDDPIAIAIFPKPVLGATSDELRRDYPDMFQYLTKATLDTEAAQAEAHAKQLGTDVDLGRASVDLTLMTLPPLEWDSFHNEVLLFFDDKHRVRSYTLTIHDKGTPGVNEQTLALLKKKWGEPKAHKTYKEKLVFHANKPVIVVEREATGAGWEITVAATDDDL